MTVLGLIKRAKKLQAKIPVLKIDLRHISNGDLERLEEHFLAAQIGLASKSLIGVSNLLEMYEKPVRKLSRTAIARICKPSSSSSYRQALMMSGLKSDALAAFTKLPFRTRK